MLTKEQAAFLERFGLKAGDSQESQGKDNTGFESMLRKAQHLQSRLSSMTSRGAALLKPRTTQLSAGITAAEQAAESGDPEKAATLLSGLDTLMRELDRDMDYVSDYVAEDQKFQKRLQEARVHRRGGGALAIQDYLDRLTEEEERRKKAEAKEDFREALAACDASDHMHTAMMQDAKRGVEFAALQTELETEIKRLEQQAPGGGTAKPVIDEVREMMKDADNFIKSDNWVGAVIMMRKARMELRVGTKGLELSEQLGPLEETDDFDAVYRQVLNVVKQLQSMKAAGPFRRELANCLELTRDAQAAMPDRTEALRLLSEARQKCGRISGEILLNGRLTGSVKQLLSQRDDMAKHKDSRCVTSEIQASARKLKEADQKAKAHEFDDALKRVDEAAEQIRVGHAALRLYVAKVGPARQAIARAAKHKRGNANWQQMLDNLDAAFAARDLRQAEQHANAALDETQAAAA